MYVWLVGMMDWACIAKRFRCKSDATKGEHLNVCSSSERVVVAGLRLSDVQVPCRPEVPDTLQVLASVSIRVECVTLSSAQLSVGSMHA